MLDQVAAEHEALSGMREKTISIGQPVNVGEQLPFLAFLVASCT